MKTVYLLYVAKKNEDRLLSVHETKGSAIKAKFIADSVSQGKHDLFIKERYVLNMGL